MQTAVCELEEVGENDEECGIPLYDDNSLSLIEVQVFRRAMI